MQIETDRHGNNHRCLSASGCTHVGFPAPSAEMHESRAAPVAVSTPGARILVSNTILP